MDPWLLNDLSFSAANSSSSILSEIWPFSVHDGLRLSVKSGEDFTNRSGLVEISGTKCVSAAEKSTVTEQNGVRKKRDLTSEDESSKMVSSCGSGNGLTESSNKKAKISGSEGENEDGSRPEGETSSGGLSKATEQKSKPELPKDYIHVRARRGQATDRHSLAERARREKISERMKILQDLIPGCNKIIRKALVLDEIINYIQSLQRQVEFLSMKLDVVSSNMNIGPKLEVFPSGYVNSNTLPFEIQQTIFDQRQADLNAAVRESQPDWLHMRIDGNLGRSA